MELGTSSHRDTASAAVARCAAETTGTDGRRTTAFRFVLFVDFLTDDFFLLDVFVVVAAEFAVSPRHTPSAHVANPTMDALLIIVFASFFPILQGKTSSLAELARSGPHLTL